MWSSDAETNSSGARVVVVVDPGVLVTGLEVRQHAPPQNPAVGRDRVPLVEPPRLVLGEGVGEGVVPLLEVHRDRLVPVRRALQHRERRLDLRERYDAHALGRCGAHRDAGGAEPVVEEDLRERATGRVADDDRRGVQLADHRLEVVDDGRHGQFQDRCRVGVQRLDLDLEPRIPGRQHPEPASLVVRDPVLPAARCDPEPVDQNDGVGHDRVPPPSSGLPACNLAAGTPGSVG